MGTSLVPPGGGGGGLEPKYQKFTSSGTFTLPEGYGALKPLLVNIQVIGGGGAGALGGTGNFEGPVNIAFPGYFGQNLTINAVNNPGLQFANGNTGAGSGGLCASQLYLTENLTITVGAAGVRNTPSSAVFTGNYSRYSDWQSPYGNTQNQSGGSGGTTTAGTLSATGGLGAGIVRALTMPGRDEGTITLQAVNSSDTNGGGGQPAGQAGAATPLLGTIAGGSNNTTPVYGSFGIGGISTDDGTHTGVSGSGGGASSVGSSGAVILTWWE